jgi:cell shape-determining protein MreC
MSSRWLTFAGLVVATGILAAGGSSALWGRPGSLLTPWQRQLAGEGQDSPLFRDLQTQVARLNTENVQLRARLEQYAQIRGEGGFPPERVVVARGKVVARTARAGRRFLELDVGSGDGVLRDQPVAAGWALAGVVIGVREGRCLVQELADSESRIPATVLDSRQVLAEGVIAGDGAPGWARLDFIAPRDGLRIDPGMNVVSAGSDGRLPAGLVIGRIEQALRGTGADHWRITVRLAADASAAESLLVLAVPATPPPAPVSPAAEPR